MSSERFTNLNLLMRWKTGIESEGGDVKDLIPSEIIRIGGLDLAERIDATAFQGLEWTGQYLKDQGKAKWQHTKYPIILSDLKKIQDKFNYDLIGFDETGGGIPIGEWFGEELPMEPISFTMASKLDMISVVKFLFQYGILKVKKGDELVQEILEQEKIKTDAGNIVYRHPQGRHDDQFWAMAIACFIAVPYIVGMAPASITTFNQTNVPQDVDAMIAEEMKHYASMHTY